MAFSSFIIKQQLQRGISGITPLLSIIRNGHTLRGKRPGVARTLQQRLQEENPQDAELIARVDIGFPKLRAPRSHRHERMQHLKVQRKNEELEKKARNHTLLISLDDVSKEYMRINRPYDVRIIADHYGVYKDLFDLAYFVPRVNLDIQYHLDNGIDIPVYNGNVIKPFEARETPSVQFDGKTDPITGKPSNSQSLWCLLATNPDSNPAAQNKEIVHWFIANIPNGEVNKGEVLIDYLQPFPPKGIGFQRFVFVLYKQNKRIDFNNFKIDKMSNNNLEKRTFKTLDFYRQYQDDITPAGLAFYQTDYDNSLTKFYHEVLNLKEPIYEYDFPDIYMADQKQFPLTRPFNTYMDRYRDIKQVNKEFLERKLAKTHPFDGPEPQLRYPNAQPLRGIPSWLRTEIRKERLKIGRINDY
uniref:Large ribosomal subunit protein mL38 n=1 Tax=Glossina morsitans morsitans TaxID=37546 RepID=A0A1B0G4S4_GLOMM